MKVETKGSTISRLDRLTFKLVSILIFQAGLQHEQNSTINLGYKRGSPPPKVTPPLVD
jgi:hypothetical protein